MVPNQIFSTFIASPVLALACSPAPYRPRRTYFSIDGGRRRSPITDQFRPQRFSRYLIPLQAISRPRILLTSITTPIRFRRSPASILTNSACLDSVFQHPHRLEAPRLPKPAAAAQPVRHSDVALDAGQCRARTRRLACASSERRGRSRKRRPRPWERKRRRARRPGAPALVRSSPIDHGVHSS